MLADCGEFVSARRLHSLTVARGMRVGLTTVYRALRDMEIHGRADVVLDERGTRYFRTRALDGHRHYIICRACGTSRALDAVVLEDWVRRVGADSDYAALEHVVQLTGVCAPCRTDPTIGESARGEPVTAAESDLDAPGQEGAASPASLSSPRCPAGPPVGYRDATWKGFSHAAS
ncbi:Fur family transcriptional regulator, ferric uptake regulator [Streptomyces zhaozhouensis]|uniref:Fur family transcriptional regulator, ferric uptake regulator n=1 Tax=Streptomyces zhaozhouensis TaxID=1300267 RepID=A0A286DVW4_9ACTN|nr:Fur family transcriptional regulator, ferric uptake regulator [Streptomyces zhaozhouensis]